MRARGVLLATATALFGAVAPALAAKTPGCHDGTTMFVSGPLRLFGIAYDHGFEWGADYWACLAGQAGPYGAGSSYGNGGTGSHETRHYAFDGRRYLADAEDDDGEGGPDISYFVTDLRTRRTVVRVTGGIYPAGPVQVTTHGDLLLGEEHEVTLHRRGGGRRVLSKGAASAMAVAGDVVYWTEGGAARSAALPGVAPGPESLALDPVGLAARRDACATAKGAVVAASPRVRVRLVHGARIACRIGAPRAVRLDRRVATVARGRAYRIAGDRWLLAREDGLLRVVDTTAGRVVTRVRGTVGAATLLHDGTVAWIGGDGAVMARPPGGRSRAIGAGGRALASAGTTVYWTAGGAPHRWTRG